MKESLVLKQHLRKHTVRKCRNAENVRGNVTLSMKVNKLFFKSLATQRMKIRCEAGVVATTTTAPEDLRRRIDCTCPSADTRQLEQRRTEFLVIEPIVHRVWILHHL